MSRKSKKGSGGDRKIGSAKETTAKSDRLPFEPTPNRKKSTAPATPASGPSTEAGSPSHAAAKDTVAKAKGEQVATSTKTDRQAAAVPEVVSRRMGRRMAFFSGIPTALGISTFLISYVIFTQHWFKLPHIAVVLVSMGFFGLGVLGLSYGVLSASWDETQLGSWHGLEQIGTNFGRLTHSWRMLRQNKEDT